LVLGALVGLLYAHCWHERSQGFAHTILLCVVTLAQIISTAAALACPDVAHFQGVSLDTLPICQGVCLHTHVCLVCYPGVSAWLHCRTASRRRQGSGFEISSDGLSAIALAAACAAANSPAVRLAGCSWRGVRRPLGLDRCVVLDRLSLQGFSGGLFGQLSAVW
jgi:hypothetical protein